MLQLVVAMTGHSPNELITEASAVESNADRPEREGGSQFGTYRRWEIVSRLLRYLRIELASLRQTAPASSEIRGVEGQNSRMSETSFPRHKLRIPINARILMLHSVHPSDRRRKD